MNVEQRASAQLLEVIWKNDYKCSWHPTGIVAVEYVYFDAVVYRKYIGYREFFDIVRSKPELF